MTYEFKTAPFEHQQRAFERFKDSRMFCLFWEMGTGKTKTIIDIVGHKYVTNQIDKVVIVAPNSVHEQWVSEEIPKHCGIDFVTHAYRRRKTDTYLKSLYEFLIAAQDKKKLPFLAIHYEAFQSGRIDSILAKYAENASRIFWVYDEGTRVKNIKTKTYQGLLKSRQRYGGGCALLTGTAMAKSPLDVYGMVELVCPGYLGMSFTSFQRRYAIMMQHKVFYTRGGVERQTRVSMPLNEHMFWTVKRDLQNVRKLSGKTDLTPEMLESVAYARELLVSDVGYIDKAQEFVRFKNIEMLKSRLQPLVSFLRKEECVQLPEKVYQTIKFELTSEQRRVIDQMRKYAVAAYEDKELTLAQKQTLTIRALQVCGGFFPYVDDTLIDKGKKYGLISMKEKNAKLEFIKSDIEELGGAPFIVWAIFTAELKMLQKELNKIVPTVLVDGSVKQDLREKAIEGFKTGEYQGLVANPTVAGYGLNLQNCGIQYWYSRSYRTEARLQAEDRSHRVGIVKSPVYKDLVYQCAFEQRVLASNREGRDMSDYFNSASVSDLLAI